MGNLCDLPEDDDLPDPITGVTPYRPRKNKNGMAPGPESGSTLVPELGVPTASLSGAPKTQAITVPPKKLGYLLEDEVPLRQSVLWDLQRSFYDEMNINCWSKAVVPNFVTSNAFVARTYAKVILEFMRDWIKNPYIYVDRKETDKDAKDKDKDGNDGGEDGDKADGGSPKKRVGGVSRHSKGKKRRSARSRHKRRKRVVDPGKPFYIIEVGAGAGKLAYLIVRRLLTLVDEGKFPKKSQV